MERALKRAVVVGLGKSGLAAAELLMARGVQVTALDEKADPQVAEGLRRRGVTVREGAFPECFFEGADAVVVSPGVPLSRPELAAARAAGVPVYGEVELAWRCLPAGAGPVLGITGTNGKSTTTALLGELVKQGGGATFVGGNLGRPFSEACATRHDAHVVELSSFQLEGIERLACLGAAILNLTPDHLDRYPDHQAYGLAKARIFQNQPPGGFAVLNADDPDTVALARYAKVPVLGFTLAEAGGAPLTVAARPHGAGLRLLSTPQRALPAPHEDYRLANRALRGAHNLQNAMAAALLARHFGVDPAAIQRGLDAFGGLQHRLELVRELGGVEWINDSKATNVDSSLVAMKALPGGVWLIAGGKGKGAPYQPLVDAARGKVRGVLTIGQDAPAIEKAFAGSFAVVPCGTLEKAVEAARERAKAGEVVLLSPACASYDQFKNFEHRGDSFKALVLALP